ncbi:hypothetical protein CW310_07440 [Pseudomonas citronellolis]|uniref:hypothetical protein n=1 Tax=Pseudomonas TaxID=286 RepID=UPI0005BCE609|nr:MULTISPECIES: hypothetical protein [Pseudomonas]MBG4910291.1 hypothetical protein [Pseudomonas aeruginosa]KWR75237.1 hypothetical protein RN02_23520 [Pseudomonas sp. PI1]TGC30855.1 hypothetical protein CW310_07440 [Pseudomonas citronellolis]UUC52295.1 hypothetical protein NOX82_10400 [Pseudomonas citronellolis]HCF4943852.1 hypothetical protein [Pseudomonas aeruginosa]
MTEPASTAVGGIALYKLGVLGFFAFLAVILVMAMALPKTVREYDTMLTGMGARRHRLPPGISFGVLPPHVDLMAQLAIERDRYHLFVVVNRCCSAGDFFSLVRFQMSVISF